MALWFMSILSNGLNEAARRPPLIGLGSWFETAVLRRYVWGTPSKWVVGDEVPTTRCDALEFVVERACSEDEVFADEPELRMKIVMIVEKIQDHSWSHRAMNNSILPFINDILRCRSAVGSSHNPILACLRSDRNLW